MCNIYASITQLLAYIGFRILSQNPQNGAVRTHAQKLGFLNPLERFSQFPAVELSGNGCSEHSQNPLGGPSARTDGDPLGRMEFPRFDLFLVLDLVIEAPYTQIVWCKFKVSVLWAIQTLNLHHTNSFLTSL